MSEGLEVFMLFVEQDGEGCDYSIACGRNLLRLKARNWEDAFTEAKHTIVGGFDPEEGYWDGDYCRPARRLKRAVLYKAVERALPIEAMYKEANAINDQIEQNNAEDAERCEYERLCAKFGEDGRGKENVQ